MNTQNPADLSQEELLNMLDEMPTETVNIEERITLPVNSPEILVDDHTARFSSAVWYEKMQGLHITLAGLGGIGSYVAFLIGRLKPASMALYDMDRVESVNISGQFYPIICVGERKTTATVEVIREFCGYYSASEYGEFTYNCPSMSSIAICGFDNMEARKTFFDKWLDYIKVSANREQTLFIDGRLAAEEFQVFCMRGTDTYLINKYIKEWLFDDEEAEETVCSYKQTSFCANMIASVMVNLLVNFVSNLTDPVIPRELPFFTRYDATTMMLKTEM